MKSEALIHEVKLITQSGMELVRKKLTHIAPNQMHWKPSEDAWSILEVIAHLNCYTQYYNKEIDEKLAATRYNSPIEYFVSSPLGKSAWKSMKLGNQKNIKRKFKSPKNFNPVYTPELITENPLDDYQALNKQFIEIVEKTKNFNLRKVRLSLSISKIAKLRLGDVLLFIAYHHERHIQQIINVLQNKNFPQKVYE